MNRAGSFITNMSGEAAYRSFRPAPLPPIPGIDLDDETYRLLVEANRQLAALQSKAESVPDTDLFLSMYVRKEALISSQIEGTQCTLEDIFAPEAESNSNLDVEDVVNYVRAVGYALERMKTLPLCCRLLRETHAVLMQGVRGEEKSPGEFRTSQNWIGAAGCSLKEARFIPPNPADMEEAMSDLEKFIHAETEYDPLVCAALIHYQFETVHPFLDGNGRIGRLLILLYLIQRGLLHKPVLYISYFLKKNQIEYYDRMAEIRRSGNYEQWIRFFLEAVEEAAKHSCTAADALSSLHRKNLEKLPRSNRKKNVPEALFLYAEQHPILQIGKTAQALGVSFNTAASAFIQLEALGILQRDNTGRRNRVFVYREYLDILREGT